LVDLRIFIFYNYASPPEMPIHYKRLIVADNILNANLKKRLEAFNNYRKNSIAHVHQKAGGLP